MEYSYYIEHIECILLFGIVGFILNWFAIQKKFYALPLTPSSPPSLCFIHVVTGFAIYLLSSIFLSQLFASVLPSILVLSYLNNLIWAQVIATSGAFLFLFFFVSHLEKNGRAFIWKDPTCQTSFLKDCQIGALTWFLSFPVVTVVEQMADTFVYALFKVETFEQVAVRYLKMALSSPISLTGALLSILFFAPVIEELLFRGFLQTWLKKHMGTKAAILIAALLFALFHVSPSHGVGNLSLVPSLFAFSCFLGFIYERQKSLFASISLHITFNLITTIRILLYPEA